MWVELAVMIVSMILSYALRPKPKAPPAQQLKDVHLPTIEQGTPVPVVFGNVWIDQWFVMWYGDMRVTPIKSSGGKK